MSAVPSIGYDAGTRPEGLHRGNLNIQHVITGLGVGGAETALCRLIESLPFPAYNHSAIALDGNGANGALKERVREAGARLTLLGMRPGTPDLAALVRLGNLLRREEPDVVHGWMYHANLALALTLTRTPLIWGIRQTVYDLGNEKPLSRAVIRAAAALSWIPKVITYNSTLSARQHEALGYRADRTKIIPNGIDTMVFRPDSKARALTRAELGISENEFVVGHIARWHPMKDHKNFVSAAAALANWYPNTRFVLIGEGIDGQNTDLSRLANDQGIAERLVLCGRRFDIPRLIAALDALALSSAWGEAFPNVLAEAMACGVPCVATDVGDAREIIGERGIVVPPRNADALCQGLLALAGLEQSARLQLGSRARARIVERYSLAVCAAAYDGLYRQIGRR